MKNLLLISVALGIFSGTSLTATAQKRINTAGINEGNSNSRSPKFIEGIEVKADAKPVSTNISATSLPEIKEPISKAKASSADVSAIERTSSLQFKYAQLLNRNVEEITNMPLYNFIEEWWNTRYRFGGTGRNGIDCSALTGLLMSTVFAIKLPRTAHEQYDMSMKLNKEDMTEGDLVFFNTRRSVSHVGVYLGNGYFVHASRGNGVIISSLDEPYYSTRFISGGRVLEDEKMAVSSVK